MKILSMHWYDGTNDEETMIRDGLLSLDMIWQQYTLEASYVEVADWLLLVIYLTDSKV